MQETIDYNTFLRMLEKAAEEIEKNHEYLSELDSFGGDGDHGTTILRAMKKLQNTVKESPPGDFKELVSNIGWSIMGVAGGATGPLLGNLFMGMADASEGKATLNINDLAAMFEGGLSKLQKYTKAQVGDKTLIDALVPAVESLRTEAGNNSTIKDAFEKTAETAEKGAESTRNLQARFGRSKNAGEKSIGHQDPGATSIALFLKGLFEGV